MKPKLGYPQLWFDCHSSLCEGWFMDSLRIIYPDGYVEVYLSYDEQWTPSFMGKNTQAEAMSEARMYNLEFICNIGEE